MTEMGDVDHTHPVTDRPFGERFDPTTAVATDGGEPGVDDTRPAGATDDEDPTPGESSEGDDRNVMADVDHESPDGEGAAPVFDRGPDERDETV